jgi:hypothetical protein
MKNLYNKKPQLALREIMKDLLPVFYFGKVFPASARNEKNNEQ